MFKHILTIGIILLSGLSLQAQQTPPYHGTIFLDPDIITADDPSCFQSLTPTGQGQRKMFDRRVNDWITVNAFLFDVIYDDGIITEFQVNPEFGNADIAKEEALQYAKVIGQLPNCLRKDVRTVSIHKGVQLYGGGNNNILIHTGQTELYVKDGILEETLVHEATHTSLDGEHALSVDWLRAALNDRNFISKYAQDNPKREDVSETFLLFIAQKIHPERISDALKQTIMNTIPNRIQYLESMAWNFYPYDGSQQAVETQLEQIAESDPTPAQEPVEPARLEWIPFDGMIPETAVIGGSENGHDLLVCRGSYNGAVHPGKLLANKCNIGWGGKEVELTSFDVLVNNGVPLMWTTYTGRIPAGAMEAGNENGRILYVGQFTRPDGSVHTGKVFGVNGNYIFNYGYGGLEITEKSNFRILVRE